MNEIYIQFYLRYKIYIKCKCILLQLKVNFFNISSTITLFMSEGETQIGGLRFRKV